MILFKFYLGSIRGLVIDSRGEWKGWYLYCNLGNSGGDNFMIEIKVGVCF